MLLRSMLEKRLPLKDGQAHLSDEARSAVFRGSYLFSHDIVRVESGRNYERSSLRKFPYSLDVIRQNGGGYDSHSAFSFNGRAAYSGPLDEIEREMMSSAKTARANYIEKLAKKVKLSGAAAVAAAGVAAAIFIPNYGSGPSAETPAVSANENGIASCSSVVSGSETLVPADTKVREFQAAGAEICSLAGHDYLVVS